ncbi:ABC transporter permease [Bacillus nakamurai]|uniref:ABC transporter permease n=1 Tax=Bacillus nakamurai TaxID=1793963 RepID=A0A150FE89_9BACI|nr:ABC transporter permease [Bacillus nakamurai]KXZ23216.1 ABC transporter permease [Bacillus nakamurai]MED1228010.1 ABC transporter permease [Bacillus nakamurai]
MSDRGLFYKEWKQNHVTFVLISAVLVFLNPLSIINTYFKYQSCLSTQNQYPDYECKYTVDFSDMGLILLHLAPAVILAVIQLGIDRSKGVLEYTLSLPYSRSQVFHAKFIIGASIIIGSQFFAYLLSELMIFLTHPGKVIYFHHYIAGMMIISLLAYSLLLGAGSLTGNVIAQLLTALSVSVLPYVIIVLLAVNAGIIFGESVIPEINFPWSAIVIYFLPIVYIHPAWLGYSKYILLIPAAMSILFYLIGLFCFIHHPNERRGYFFLWKKFERPIQILVIAIGILGCGAFGYYSVNSYFGYAFGMLIGAVIGFLISYFLIYKKTKLI